MKKLMAVLVVLLAAGPALANDKEESARKDRMVKECKFIEQLSTTIMSVRQHGAPAIEAYSVFDPEQGDSEEDKNFKKLGRVLVEEAYSMDLMHTEKFQQQRIREFANKQFLECLAEVRAIMRGENENTSRSHKRTR